MINLIIASSIRLLFYMNLVGSVFLFLSIGATHLFNKQLAPKHKLLFYKVNKNNKIDYQKTGDKWKRKIRKSKLDKSNYT